MGKGNTQVARAAFTSPPSYEWRTQSRTGSRYSFLAATPADAANPMLALFNLTGHLAVSLPEATSAGGLPSGFQLVGQPWREMELLAAAGRLCPGPAPLPDLA